MEQAESLFKILEIFCVQLTTAIEPSHSVPGSVCIAKPPSQLFANILIRCGRCLLDVLQDIRCGALKS